ncbi:hypothetical protein Tco_1236921 [Tanacetum coccineum]
MDVHELLLELDPTRLPAIHIVGNKSSQELILPRIDQGMGSTSGIRVCALRNFDLSEIKIKQYFQIQDYALWEVIENGNLWVPIPIIATETGPSTGVKMTVPSTAEEKTAKKNDVKLDLEGMKQQYENFNASSSESLDYIFNRLQKLVSRLAIMGVVTPPEDLNIKFLRSLPSEWDIHVVVWMNKPDFDTMGLDDLYNNFKIVEQKVKRSTGTINDEKNLAFLTTSGASSINNINTVNPEVSTGHEQMIYEFTIPLFPIPPEINFLIISLSWQLLKLQAMYLILVADIDSGTLLGSSSNSTAHAIRKKKITYPVET